VQVTPAEVCIARSHGEHALTKQLRHRGERDTALDQVGGVAVPGHVDVERLHPDAATHAREGCARNVAVEGSLVLVGEDELFGRVDGRPKGSRHL
jgi:hypothetical protein